jgi:hypothetical protein
MDKIAHYRQSISEILRYYASMPSLSNSADEELEEQLILDSENDHYQILTIGWEEGKRVYYPIFHLDIKNGKIWVQEDATDFDIVGALEEKGVAKSDIVLAFHAPYKRPYTGYAVA